MHEIDYCGTTMGTIINSMVLVSSSLPYTLVDTGASHSFISVLFTSMLGLEYEWIDCILSVYVPLGRDYELSCCDSLVYIEIDRRWFLAYLIIMPMEHFDVILDMYLLSQYWAVIDWLCRWVTLFYRERSSCVSKKLVWYSTEPDLKVLHRS